ncbi:MAG: YicC family protein [Clostridia bacterium]|nr:YicC family protein [Clostridia bacterium]
MKIGGYGLVYSMTGFGKAEYKNGYELTVEIKTVNNRFLDILPKYPKSFIVFDDAIRKTIQSKLTRGRVEVFFTFSDARDVEKQLGTDLALAKAYYKSAEQISSHLGIENDLTVSRIMRMPEVVSQIADEVDENVIKQIVISTLSLALDKLNDMRFAEGEKLKKDLNERIDEVERLVSKLALKAPLVAENYHKKITERVRNILESTQVDEARLLQEVAIFADKSNIDEELTRLNSHIAQFRSILSDKNAGRKLDFLVQEFNREANTVCSKANDVEVTNVALLLKCEIEKIREQIQNIE